MDSSELLDQVTKINLQQLKILLQSQLIVIKQINIKQINSQQILLIYLYQLQKQIELNQNSQLKHHLEHLCRNLLNNEFQKIYSEHLQRQSYNLHQNYENINQDYNSQTIEQDQQGVFDQQSKYLGQQILRKIHLHFPQTYDLIDEHKIYTFSHSHCQKILTLLQIEFQNQQTFYKQKQILLTTNKIILPIIFKQFGLFQKSIKLLKTIMNIFNSNYLKQASFVNSLSKVATDFYLKITEEHKCLTDHQVIALMTVFEVIHNTSQAYNENLVKSNIFCTHINRMLLCSNANFKNTNSIAVNIYGSLLKQLNLYCNQAQIFINLYSILGCFGVHLIKDVWPLFYDLIQIEDSYLIFSKAELIDIIFYKIEHHQNAHVVKYCIQSILQQQRSYILFNKVPDAIFNSLMRILNYGIHYLDCIFHMDSKMFPIISNFFSKFLNHSNFCKNQDFQTYLKLILKAIYQKISFDHALVAMLNVFTLIERKSNSVGKQQLQWILILIRKHYHKFPIRKRHQMMKGICCLLQNHLNTTKKGLNQSQVIKLDLVSLQYFIQNCLQYFPNDYIQLKNINQKIKKQLSEIIFQNYKCEEINETLQKYIKKIEQILKNRILTNQYFRNIILALKSLQLIFYLLQNEKNQIQPSKIYSFHYFVENSIDKARKVYTTLYERFVIDLGESLYKDRSQRAQGIQIQKICLDKVFIMKFIVPTFNIYDFLRGTLINLSLFIKECIDSETRFINIEDEISVSLQIVKKIFQMIYQKSNDNQNIEEKASRIGSQFLQWATDNISYKQCQLLMISVLKTRIQEEKKYKIYYVQESIYRIFWLIFDLEYISKPDRTQQSKLNQKQNQLKNIAPLYRLRLFVLCGSILFNDDKEVKEFLPSIFSNIDELVDRYDYNSLDQVYYFVELVYTCQQNVIDKNIKEKIYPDSYQKSIVSVKYCSKLIYCLIQCMLTQLNYGLDIKQAISCVNCIINIVFRFASKYNNFSSQLISVCQKILQIGSQNWMFQRIITFKIIENLQLFINTQLDFTLLFPLLSKIICIEEYRGYDSAAALEGYLRQNNFYTKLKSILNKQSDYEGTTCRLAFVHFIDSLVKHTLLISCNQNQKLHLDRFLSQLFVHIFKQIKKQNKQKMFLVGKHKIKLKHWQCLIVYNCDWIYQHSQQKLKGIKISIEQLIVECIQMISESSNLIEIKYYVELFLMRLLINKNSDQIVSAKVLKILCNKLLHCTSQISKNISFIVISGILMNHMFNNYHIQKNHQLYQDLHSLYNALLTYSCSHIAYFRGLSQYFCLQMFLIESEYSSILYKTLRTDSDTITLGNKLKGIIQDYIKEINSSSTTIQFFKQIPSMNGNIIPKTYYLERIKKLGEELLRQVKGELGFVPYKQIWVQAVKSLKLVQSIKIDLEKQALSAQKQEQAVFQRKIDPSLDFIYFSNTKLEGFEMKILITGSSSIPIYGHLSRTGQIFGLSQLVIPYKEIIENEDYKSVACTAEKWLNIRAFSNKSQIENRQKFHLSLKKELILQQQQGYKYFLLKKNRKLSSKFIQSQLNQIHSIRKVLLILDSEDYLPISIQQLLSEIICFGQHFSQHVEASIFIWQYFKSVYNQKFRSQKKNLNKQIF